jgi:transketolase
VPLPPLTRSQQGDPDRPIEVVAAQPYGPSDDRLEALARQVRIAVIRAVAHAGGGHIGGPLSAADLLVALYFRILNIRPEQPDWPERDRFILSKGHSAIALYATMALRGYFPIEELASFDALDSRLQGHPDMTCLPGIDMSTGSLGLGLCAGVGMALGARLRESAFRTFVMVGDGECQEGSVWEAATVAARYRLDNLTVVVDANGLQQFGWLDGDRHLPPFTTDELAARWASCGWEVIACDGHSFPSIFEAFSRAMGSRNRPTVIIARTVKGKGVPFMEGRFEWHSRVPTTDELKAALRALGEDES